MAYMVYQRLTTAILETYAGRPDVARHLAAARACRAWLESLEIDPRLRDALVEPIVVLEEAFQGLAPVESEAMRGANRSN